mgnify:FL=1
MMPDSTFGIPEWRLKQWASNRATDRQSLRYTLSDIRSLEEQLANGRNKVADLERVVVELKGREVTLLADNGAKDITIMNQAAIIAPLTTWARVGKWGTVAVGITTLWVAYKALKP